MTADDDGTPDSAAAGQENHPRLTPSAMISHFGRRRRDPPNPDPDRPGPGDRRGRSAADEATAQRVRVSFDRRNVQATTIRILLIVSTWLIAAWVVGAAQHFLFLILLAWLAAIASEPAIRWFLRRGLSRSRSTAIVGTLVILVCLALMVVLQRALFDQAAQLVQSIPTAVTTIVEQLNAQFGLQLDAAQVSTTLKLQPDQLENLADMLGSGWLGWVGSLVSVVFDTVTVVVFAFYIAAAGPKLIQQVAVWLPPDRQPVLGAIWDIAEQKTGGYVASKIVLAAASALFHGIFFYAVGLPGWLPLALLAGITAQFIPVIGTYIGVAIPVFVALADKPITAVWIVLFAIVYQQLETYVFTPRVSQRTMEVNPAIALASVFLGAAIWGPIGAIIGVPIAAAIVSVVQTYGRRYQLVPGMTAASNDSEPAGPEVNPVAHADPASTSEPAKSTDPATPTPVHTAPVHTAPVDTAPVDTAPVDTAPVHIARVDTAPVHIARVDTAPVHTAPLDTGPAAVAKSPTPARDSSQT
ncbi:MAG: AI-2E family transporter [Nakamurella sp.]